jgi:7-cyano-7-deazaguanine synthase in queuosine biosynthesis
MCQIIALKTDDKAFDQLKEIDHVTNALQHMLQEKGGDYYGATIKFYGDFVLSLQVPKFETIRSLFKDISIFIEEKKFQGNFNILLFSRQQPEMENANVQEQPYISKVDTEDLTFAVHGTIHNDKDLANKNKVVIGADTEILQYLSTTSWQEAQGSFCVIGLDNSEFIVVYEHGMKVWSNYITLQNQILAEIVATTSLEIFNPMVLSPIDVSRLKDRILFTAFSGGMDISLSVYKQLTLGNYEKLVLNYFDWGSNAANIETRVTENMGDFYSSEFGIPVEVNILPAFTYFKSFFNITETSSKISDAEAKGDRAETESPIAYVPYRNSQFAIMLASKAEAQGLKNVDILFGLNLSEGMVFMDNSEGWIKAIEDTINYGGKDFSITGTYRIAAPYFPRTKTNMIKEFQDEFGKSTLYHLLEKSWSCYYPDEEGHPCGECGSCILRQESIHRALGD